MQVLPLAYDVHKKAWYDTAASGVRHFADRRDEALPWTDRMFTFNTTCFNCHVSQLRTNYDLASRHLQDHVERTGHQLRIVPRTGQRSPPRDGNRRRSEDRSHDIKIIRAKEFTAEQTNDMCATCHAKLVPLSLDFLPGDKFFDHFDLVVLDHPDYYPDGRDLGENYTYTSWMMSPCASSGKLDCNHCHTPSGRYAIRGHGRQQVLHALPSEAASTIPLRTGITRPGSKGNDCIGCHMPMTRFAAMGRTDHSMRPPTPATTIAFKSPNACNFCHADKDAAWSEDWVRKWYPRDYQAPVMERASLLDAARKGDWKRLPQMLEKIARPEEDAVYKASLVRLVRGCQDESKWPVLVKALGDKSPLVRSSAASALAGHLNGETIPRCWPPRAILPAGANPGGNGVGARSGGSTRRTPKTVNRSGGQLRSSRAAMKARPDDWAGYANLGTFYMEQRDFQKAVDCFETATRLEPRMVGPMVNASMAYSNLRQNDQGRVESSPRPCDGAQQPGCAVQPGPLAGRGTSHGGGGESPARGPEGRSADGGRRLQPRRALRQGENRRGAAMVSESVRTSAKQCQVRPHAGLLPA